VVVLALVGGVVTGAGTQVLQGELPQPFSFLANSGSPWAAAAFAVGALSRTRLAAAPAGAGALATAAVAYYVAVDVFEGNASDSSSPLVWAAAGVVTGAVFGVAGHLARRSEPWRWPAVALLAGVQLLEGIGHWFVNPHLRGDALVMTALGAGVLALALVRSRREGAVRRVVAVACLAAVAAAIGVLAVGRAFAAR